MKFPKTISGNIVIDADGSPWAVYCMAPWLYGVGSDAERLAVLDNIERFVAAIPYRALILGVAHEATTEQLCQIVRGTTGARPSERWDRYVTDTVGTPGRGLNPTIWREWWVAVALRRPNGAVGETLSLLRGAVSGAAKRLEGDDPAELAVQTAERAAAGFVHNLGTIGKMLVPATHREIGWLYARAFRRGSEHEPRVEDIPERFKLPSLVPKRIVGPTYSAVAELDTGGRSHTAVIRIDDVPHEITVPGGGQWVWQLNELPFNVDAAIWVETIPTGQAVKKNRRRRQNLHDQSNQLGASGPTASLGTHQDDAGSLEQRLGTSRQPYMKHTYAVIVGADSGDELNERVGQVRGLYPDGLFKAYPVAGQQDRLILSACPGMEWPLAVTSKDVAQFGMPDSVSASCLLCGIELGDPCGIPLGTTATGMQEPVFFDPGWGPTRKPHASPGSIVVVGKTGSGKGITAKVMLRGSIAAGHQVVVVDRSTIRHTGRGEYEPFFDAIECSSQVIALHEDAMTMNPWMCLPPSKVPGAARFAAQEILMMLCQVVSETDDVSLTIGEACEYAEDRMLHGYGDHSGWDLVLHYLNWASSPQGEAEKGHETAVAARRIEKVLRFCQARPSSTSIFGTGSPLRFDHDATVIWAPHLKLPEPGDDEPTLDQIIGRSVMGLIVLLGRHLFAANAGRYGALVIDEAWALLSTKAGARWLTEFAREGRKSGLGVWIFTQLPSDVPNDVLEQMGYVGVTRVESSQVPDAMRILQVPLDSDAASTVDHTGAGILTWRDCQGRVGAVKVRMPDDEELARAMDTTPELASV